MKKIYLFITLYLLSSFTYALSDAQYIEKLIKQEQYAVAVIELEKVTKEYPDSKQANCYMAAVLKHQNKDASLYEAKCGDFIKQFQEQDKKNFNKTLGWICFVVFSIPMLVFVFIFGSRYLNKCKDIKLAKELEIKKEENRKTLLKEIMIANEQLNNTVMLLETSSLNDKKKKKYITFCKEWLNKLINAIEIVQESGDYDSSYILEDLREIDNLLYEIRDVMENV